MSIRIVGALATLTLVTLSPLGTRSAAAQIEVAEATIRELQAAMSSGRATSATITAAYLARIEAYDRAGPRLNSMLRVNPNALAEAEASDRERATSGARGPLHGIPVVLKDNYDTHDMPTSAGTLSLAAHVAPDDAFQVRKLREAGAVILGKTNMHELASGITTIASLGGQTLNPYDPTRNPGGSSGGTGTAVAASFAAIGWGSDTCGSIRIPSAHNNLVGLRATKGLSSIDGIVPLSATQDVGGPLARTVEDLAIALDATIGADPADPATAILEGRDLPNFVAALDADALDGAVIGIFEPLYGSDPEDAAVGEIVRSAARRMEDLGATVVTVDMPTFQEAIGGSGVIGHEFKWDLMDYLAASPAAPVASLGEMIDLGLIHDAVMGTMRRWNEPETRETDAYRSALAGRETLEQTILSEMNARGVDAIVYPTIRRVAARIGDPQRGSACQLSAHTGLPALALPAGWSDGLPVGMELMGRPFDDARLVAMGYALEQATEPRRPPRFAPPLAMGSTPSASTAEVRVTSGSATLTGRFEYDATTARLHFALGVTGAAADDVHAVVLRRVDDEGRWSVAAQLSGPGVVSTNGSLALSGSMRDRLQDASLYLELVTRGQPVSTERAPLVLTR